MSVSRRNAFGRTNPISEAVMVVVTFVALLGMVVLLGLGGLLSAVRR